MTCTRCGGDDLSSRRRVELTKEIGTVAIEARDDAGNEILEELKAIVCRRCGAVQLVVGVEGRVYPR